VRADTLQSLIGYVYDAVLDDAQWEIFLAELAQATRGRMPGMLPAHPRTRELPETFVLDQDPEFQRSFDTYYGGLVVPLMDHVPEDGLYVLDELAPARFESWEFYADWMRPQGLRHSLGQTTLRADGLVAAYSVYREPQAGPFDAEDAELMRAVAPHFARAVQLRDVFAVLRTERDAATQALERLSVGMVLFDPGGRMLAANAIAQRIADAGDGVRISGKSLSLAHRGSERTLKRLLKEALATACNEGTGPGGGALAVPRPSERHPYEVLVTPLPRDRFHFGSRRAAVAVFIADPEQGPRVGPEVLRRLYGLTSAEARLAIRLAQGDRLEDAAQALGIAIGTARNQLAQVFAKTDTHRQAELVRRVLAGIAQLDPQ
jgi:DNA-binding CsgD family transcriptional regulator/GAF domain-containing protein